MIKSYANEKVEQLFQRAPNHRFRVYAQSARQLLAYVNAAVSLDDLAAIPATQLKPPEGPRGKYSLRLNILFQVRFVWREPDAYEVEIWR